MIPAGEFTDLRDRLLLQVEEPDDQLIVGFQLSEELVDEFLGSHRIVGGHLVLVGHDGVENLRLAFGQVRPAELRTAFLRPEMVDARGDRDPRDESAPYGFSTRVAALAFSQSRRIPSLVDRFALRAVGLASLLALASVVFNFTTTPGSAPVATDETTTSADDAMTVLLDV